MTPFHRKKLKAIASRLQSTERSEVTPPEPSVEEVVALRKWLESFANAHTFGTYHKEKLLTIASKLATGAWIDGPPPVRDDGNLIIVELVNDAAAREQMFHVGAPFIVAQYKDRLEATLKEEPFPYSYVKRWTQLAAKLKEEA